jgi:hypothetical protein
MDQRYGLVYGSFAGGKVYGYARGYILDAEQHILWLSLFGGSTSIKALSAQLFGGGSIEIRTPGARNPIVSAQKGKNTLRALTQAASDIVHKIIFQPGTLIPWKSELQEKRIVTFGRSIDEAKLHLFRSVDRLVPTPLSSKWTWWVWENVEDLDLTLFAPAIEQFTVCRYVRVPDDFEARLLDDLKNGELVSR